MLGIMQSFIIISLKKKYKKYIDQLKTLGYAEEASASESVSTGVLLRKDETWISIAYSEGGFGIRISVEKILNKRDAGEFPVIPMMQWKENGLLNMRAP